MRDPERQATVVTDSHSVLISGVPTPITGITDPKSTRHFPRHTHCKLHELRWMLRHTEPQPSPTPTSNHLCLIVVPLIAHGYTTTANSHPYLMS